MAHAYNLITAGLVGTAFVGAFSGPLRAAVQAAQTVYQLGLRHCAASGVWVFIDAFRHGARTSLRRGNFIREIRGAGNGADDI